MQQIWQLQQKFIFSSVYVGIIYCGSFFLGFTLAALTNSPQSVVDSQMANAGIDGFFKRRLSIGSIDTYKPHVATYQWASREMGAAPGDCLLVAAHGWDIAGALRAGLRGVFLGRPGAQLYPLGPSPEQSFPGLAEAADYLIGLWEA